MSPGSSAIFASLQSPAAPETGNQRFYHGDASPSRHFYTPPKTPANGPKRGLPVIFGLPGAPIASAACMRFLVTPYVKQFSGMPEEEAMLARIAITPGEAFARQSLGQSMPQDLVIEGSAQFDIFRHGIVRSHDSGVIVEVGRDRNISKASPFASANCWVHVPRGHVGHGDGAVATVYPFCSPRS
ncbi:hypothetical protein KC317_g19838 [Hortaea werneckii]|nr:hypothetical protein KC317_g19838 [Hortaea werneckii]